MNAGRRIVAAAGVLLLLLGAVFGCSLLLRDEAQQTGWHIRLNIAAPAASRAINVSEHEVTALIVRVYDPDDQLLETIDWQPDQGPRSYLVPVSQVGQHRIEVTHIGEDNGTAVQALESALFTIQAMRITVIDIVPGAIGVIQIDGEEADPASWMHGEWLLSKTGAPHVDLVKIDPDGTFGVYGGYDGSGGLIFGGTWSLDNSTWSAVIEGNLLTSIMDKTDDNQFFAGSWDPPELGPGDVYFYRKGFQPGGWIFDHVPTELTTGEEVEAFLEHQDLRLYSFTAPGAGFYEVRVDPGWEEDVLGVDVYADDEATVLWSPGDYPPELYLAEGQTVFIVVDAYRQDIAYSLKVVAL